MCIVTGIPPHFTHYICNRINELESDNPLACGYVRPSSGRRYGKLSNTIYINIEIWRTVK